MSIRRIRNNEIEFLSDMLYEAIFIPKGQEPLPKEIIQDKSLVKYVENWGKDKFDVALVAEVDGQPVGAIWGRQLKDENKGFGFIDNDTPELSMAVKSKYRNKGIGTGMIKKIVYEYQSIGVEQLSLSVDKANDASRLYQRLGFKIVEETETSLTMKKKLK